MNSFEIILYVSDQQRSRDFYAAVLEKQASLDVPGMTEFDLAKGLKLGLMPEENIVKILGDKTPEPKTGSGIPRCELYIHCADPQQKFELALSAGAKAVSAVSDRDWGDAVGYLCDPDGHIIAFAKKIHRAGETAASIEELYEIALGKFPASGENMLAWDQLSADEQAKMQNYFVEDTEKGLLRYKRDDLNWTALTTHQVFGKNEGEFCCFRISEIQSVEPADTGSEQVKASLTVSTAFEKFDFEYETGAGGDVLVQSLSSFQAYWTAGEVKE